MGNIEYKIYKLIDPRNNEVRYIGLTFNSLKLRLKSHRSEKSKSHKSNWIKLLLKNGYSPIIELIEGGISTYDIACEREIYWISKFKEDGHKLTNEASGGNKNKKMSEEVRLKMSLSRKAWLSHTKLILSEESKKKISESTKLRMQDPKEIEKLRISNKRYEDLKTEEQKINDILIQDCKPIIQYTKDMEKVDEYLSIRDAERKTGVYRSNISKCCKLKVKSAGGFIWRYKAT
jgi:group I intron endonuclease